MWIVLGDGVGPEISSAVQKIFETANAPIKWDPVDVTPVRGDDGIFRIPSKFIFLLSVESVG